MLSGIPFDLIELVMIAATTADSEGGAGAMSQARGAKLLKTGERGRAWECEVGVRSEEPSASFAPSATPSCPLPSPFLILPPLFTPSLPTCSLSPSLQAACSKPSRFFV